MTGRAPVPGGDGRGRSAGSADALPRRLAALEDVATLGEGRLDPALLAAVRRQRARAGERLALSGAHTVVALAGATGSGKSSLFNAVGGAPLSDVGVRRPTTSTTQACVWGDEEPAGLLAWLQVGRRVEPADTAGLEGLVLLDLPDHDSTVAEHRVEVDRLVAHVDLLVWVVDPQKYADAVLHERYLRPLADHAAVMLVVLNQVDLLTDADRERCMTDLRRLLAEDGLRGVEVLATSARTGAGVAELRTRLAEAVRRRQAAAERLSADLDRLGRDLDGAVPTGPAEDAVGRGDRDRVTRALAQAAGVDAIVSAVAAAHRARGVTATGWPPTRWLRRLRPDPLRRLHLDRPHTPHPPAAPVPRSSLPAVSTVARSQVDLAVRGLADTATAGLPEGQVRGARRVLQKQVEPLADRLDLAVSGTDLGMGTPPRWWRAADIVQWLVLLVALTGLGWLGVDVALAWLQLPALPSVDVGRLPLPTVLLLGGVVLGLLLALLFRLLVRVGARRRAARARARLLAAVEAVAREEVLGPLGAELDAWRRLRGAVESVRRLG